MLLSHSLLSPLKPDAPVKMATPLSNTRSPLGALSGNVSRGNVGGNKQLTPNKQHTPLRPSRLSSELKSSATKPSEPKSQPAPTVIELQASKVADEIEWDTEWAEAPKKAAPELSLKPQEDAEAPQWNEEEWAQWTAGGGQEWTDAEWAEWQASDGVAPTEHEWTTQEWAAWNDVRLRLRAQLALALPRARKWQSRLRAPIPRTTRVFSLRRSLAPTRTDA